MLEEYPTHGRPCFPLKVGGVQVIIQMDPISSDSECFLRGKKLTIRHTVVCTDHFSVKSMKLTFGPRMSSMQQRLTIGILLAKFLSMARIVYRIFCQVTAIN